MGYLYNANIASTLRNLIAIRFLSLQIGFLPLGVPPNENTGFVFLEGGLEVREGFGYSETASGQKYTAKFPYLACVSPEHLSTQFEYTWPQNYIQNVENSKSIDKIKVHILKEDSTSGELIPMTNVNYSNLELELYLAINSKQTY